LNRLFLADDAASVQTHSGDSSGDGNEWRHEKSRYTGEAGVTGFFDVRIGPPSPIESSEWV
jgi:hypothetical protein